MGTGHLDITLPRAPKCWENGVSWWHSLELQEQCQLATVVLEVVIIAVLPATTVVLPATTVVLPATTVVLEVVIIAVLVATGILDPQAIGPQDLPALGIPDPRAIGPQDLPALGILDLRAIGPQDLQATTLALEVVIIADLLATTADLEVALVSVDLAALIVDKAVAQYEQDNASHIGKGKLL